MPIIRIQKRENPYVQIDRAAIEDNRLSWRSRGILAYLLSKPDAWCINVFDIVNHGTEGRDAVQKALKELKRFGYAKLQTTRDEKGRVTGKEWIITEDPINGFSVDRSAAPTTGITDVGKNRKTVNPIHSNNKKSSNNKTTLPDSQAKSGCEREGHVEVEHVPVRATEEPNNTARATGYTFAEFWNDYGHKVGSKAKAERAFGQLSGKSRDAIRDTLPLYLRDTVTKDTARAGGNFRPLRQHPLTYLNGRVWETYADQAAAAKNEPPTPYDEIYREYLAWVGTHCPEILRQTAQLSKAQFVSMKETSYVRGIRDIGPHAERNTLKRAHEEYATNVAVSARHADVFSYHCELIERRVKSRQV